MQSAWLKFRSVFSEVCFPPLEATVGRSGIRQTRLGVFDSCDSEGVCWIVRATTRCSISNRQSRDCSWLKKRQKCPRCAPKPRGKQAEERETRTQSCATHQAHLDTSENEGWAKKWLLVRAGRKCCGSTEEPQSPRGAFWLQLWLIKHGDLGVKAEKRGRRHRSTRYSHRVADNRASSGSGAADNL